MHSVNEYLVKGLSSRFPHFRHNSVQVDYASSMSEALAHGNNSIHFVEGDTGIGKSLGYLLTLADWTARGKRHGRRAIVSTHSRALQRQLMHDENQAIMKDYLESQGLPSLTSAIRMGRANYVSPSRLAVALGVADLAHAVRDPSLDNEAQDLARWALDTEGCLAELDTTLTLDIQPEDICLLDSEPLPEALKAHFDNVQQSDIVTVNHSLLVLDLVRNGVITAANAPYALLLDEAEHYPSTAERMLANRMSFRTVRNLLRELNQHKAASTWHELYSQHVSTARAGQVMTLTAEANASILEAIRQLLKARPRESRVSHSIWSEWVRTRTSAKELKRYLEGQSRNVILEHSSVRGYPSIVQMDTIAGASLQTRAAERVTILTSATLSDMGHGPHEQPTYKYICGRLGLQHGDSRVGLRHSHQAVDFGRLEFRLPYISTPPLERAASGEYRLSPVFARRAVEEILAGAGGRQLVLCVSYRDVQQLLDIWPEESSHRVVTHGPGASLNQIAQQLPEDGILLTPAGWEGLSPARAKGEAFWSHVVLLRNPTPSPDPVAELLLTQRLSASVSREEAARISQRTHMNRNVVATLHKLRQGMGRGVRHPDDSTVVTILDPRFPRPDGANPSGVKIIPQLLGAIPFRFLPAYEAAAGQEKEPLTSASTRASRLIL